MSLMHCKLNGRGSTFFLFLNNTRGVFFYLALGITLVNLSSCLPRYALDLCQSLKKIQAILGRPKPQRLLPRLLEII